MKIKDALLGKTIQSFELAQDGDHIVFAMKDGSRVKLETCGDCCSTTWIESIDAPDALIGTVQQVEQIAMPDLGDIDGTRHTGVDSVSYYGLKIVTEKGIAVLDYRNDSNGYYGGSLAVAPLWRVG